MASRLKSSQVREGAKALQPLALVALVGIIGTVTLLGGCGGGSSFNSATPSPLVPIPVTPTTGTTPTPTPSGSTSASPSASPGTSPTPSGSTSPTATPTPTPTPNTLTLNQALTIVQTTANATVSALGLGPDDGWAVAYSVPGATATDPTTYAYLLSPLAPKSLDDALKSITAAGGRIQSITLGAGDVWLVTYNQTSDSFTEYQYNGIDASMLSQLISLRLNQNVNVKSAVIGSNPATWALVVNQNGYVSQNLPSGLKTQLDSLSNNGSVTINDIALGADDSYGIVFNNNQIAPGSAAALLNFVNGGAGSITTINAIGLGQAGSSAIVYNGNRFNLAGVTRSR